MLSVFFGDFNSRNFKDSNVLIALIPYESLSGTFPLHRH